MMLLSLLTCLATVCLLTEAFITISTPHHHNLRTIKNSHSIIHRLRQHDDGDDDGEEWRAFRARLVQNGLPSLDNPKNSTSSSSSKHNRYAHITTPLVEVGSILVSIPTTDLCQALEQQYWHRSVVLITEVSDNLVQGNIETDVPEDELAMGDKRGRWSYRGLLLNRCTNSLLVHDHDVVTTTMEEYERDTWIVHRGGDLLGLSSISGTQFACLYNQSGQQQSDMASTKLVGNISYTTLSIAQAVCNEYPTKYHPNDFMTFAGFCSWRPGQLEREMGESREEWVVLSVDGQSIWDELIKQREVASEVIAGRTLQDDDNISNRHEILLNAGTNMWRNYLEIIDMSESKATRHIPKGQLHFYDQMLSVWAEEQLIHHSSSVKSNKEDDGKTNAQTTKGAIIKPGSIVRAKSPPSNDMLLYDAEFLRSLVLVLEERSDCTIGVILNHPMSAAIDCKESEGPLPLRYGGPIDVQSWQDGSYRDDDGDFDDGEDDDSDDEVYEGFMDYQNNAVDSEDISFDDYLVEEEEEEDMGEFLWIHRSSTLGKQRVGNQLGSSNFWLIKEDEALEHIQSGTLFLDDVMVFSSVSIWEKESSLGSYGGGLCEQIDGLHSMEVTNIDEYQIDDVWQVLAGRQSVLTKQSLDSNIDAAIKAWNLCSSGGEQNLDETEKERLSTCAMKAFLARSLLSDPLNTLVEL